jgi:hypothetical protein
VLAVHVHWTYEDLLNLDHAERHRWIEEVLTLDET